MQYISSIRPQAEIYGICKIIPPEGWAPPLALDKASFKFDTVIQAVHRLQDRLSLPAQQAFYEELRSVMSQEGKVPKKAPSFGGREVDLYKMYRAVAKRGGYAAVTEEKKWKDIVRVLQVRTRDGLQQLKQHFGKQQWFPCWVLGLISSLISSCTVVGLCSCRARTGSTADLACLLSAVHSH